MKTIFNTLLPPRGFAAINLFGILFVRRGVAVTPRLLAHEGIHTAQMKEMLYVGFYLWYVAEWLVRLCLPGNAYRSISFEREAYAHESEAGYAQGRKPYAWTRYLREDK